MVKARVRHDLANSTGAERPSRDLVRVQGIGARMLILADSGPVPQAVLTAVAGGFRWIESVAANRATLSALAEELGFPDSVIEDCMDTHQLPKVERSGAWTFIVLRMHVGPMTETAASANEVTQP